MSGVRPLSGTVSGLHPVATMLRRLPLALLLVWTAPACDGATSSDPAARRRSVTPCEPGRVCLEWRSFDVVFTNPVCADYLYPEPVARVGGGGMIAAKPKNVYCTFEKDSVPSGSRLESPQSRLRAWIDSTGPGDEIFIASLSFSDPVVFQALCDTRAEVTLVLDKKDAKARALEEECGKTVLTRGHTGGIGFQHNKLLMVNPRAPGPSDPDRDFVRMAIGSANYSSGTHLHHENWQFIEASRRSFFVENHVCLLGALLDPAHTVGKTPFREALVSCRARIPFPPEDDVRTFFIPALEDRRAAADTMLKGVNGAATVDVAAHRFGHPDLIAALAERLESDPGFSVRMVADDDLYWLGPLAGAPHKVGPNEFFEADNVKKLEGADGEDDQARLERFSQGRYQIRYMETHHGDKLLHHNKILIFNGLPERDGVLAGAANLTRTGFEENLENIYYFEIAHVVRAFREQFEMLWGGPVPDGFDQVPPRATPPDEMPVQNVSLK